MKPELTVWRNSELPSPEISLCIRTYWKYIQVLFTNLVCTAFVESIRDMCAAAIQRVVIAKLTCSQCLERLYQSLRPLRIGHWCCPSPVQTLRILRYTSIVYFCLMNLRYSWWTTVWCTVKRFSHPAQSTSQSPQRRRTIAFVLASAIYRLQLGYQLMLVISLTVTFWSYLQTSTTIFSH